MDFQSIVILIKEILVIITILTGAYLSIKFFRKFTPVITFRITPTFSVTHPDIVLLRIEIENKSKVQIKIDKREDKGIKFKIIRHSAKTISQLNEWVDIKGADQICTSTICLYPGEIVKVERMYRCTNDEILQGIVQINAKFSKTQRLLVNTSIERWTSTFIITK